MFPVHWCWNETVDWNRGYSGTPPFQTPKYGAIVEPLHSKPLNTGALVEPLHSKPLSEDTSIFRNIWWQMLFCGRKLLLPSSEGLFVNEVATTTHTSPLPPSHDITSHSAPLTPLTWRKGPLVHRFSGYTPKERVYLCIILLVSIHTIICIEEELLV